MPETIYIVSMRDRHGKYPIEGEPYTEFDSQAAFELADDLLDDLCYQAMQPLIDAEQNGVQGNAINDGKNAAAARLYANLDAPLNQVLYLDYHVAILTITENACKVSDVPDTAFLITDTAELENYKSMFPGYLLDDRSLFVTYSRTDDPESVYAFRGTVPDLWKNCDKLR